MSLFFTSSSLDNCVTVTTRLLQLLNVKVTKETIVDKILEHPNHPSLLAISDALEDWNMNVLAVNIVYEQLIEAKTACIAQIKKEDKDYFVTIKNCYPKEVYYYDEANNFVKQSKEDFIKLWTGIVLFAETTEHSGESLYQQKIRIKNSNAVIAAISGIALFVWSITSFTMTPNLLHSITAVLFLVTGILGIFVSIFLLWYEVDAHNPLLQQICAAGKKTNCGAVLDSKESRVVFGIFTWSEIGFAYFVASTLLILVLGKEITTMLFLGNLSLLSIPVIIMSIYYQAIKIKQFCLMCLVVQILLIINVGITLVTGYYDLSVNMLATSIFISFFSISLLLWRITKPILLNAKHKVNTQRSFNKLKNNPNVFIGLLQASKSMGKNSSDLGITLGSTNAKYKVTKVCNPYCPPCANAHPILEGLVHKGLIQLQIIFTSSPEIENKKALPTRHLMALADQKIDMHQALDDWYLADNKDYELYSSKYPLNGGIAQQTDKIKAMRDWCDLENITHTPTIYINDHLLPKEYWIDDLVDVLV